MLKDSALGQNRFEKFIDEVVETQIVYAVYLDKALKEIAMSASHDYFADENEEDPFPVITFWSEKYKAYGTAFWSLDFEGNRRDVFLTPMPLVDFLDLFLAKMDDENIIAGINWDNQGFGTEIEAADLYQLIMDKLQEKGITLEEPQGDLPQEQSQPSFFDRLKKLFS